MSDEEVIEQLEIILECYSREMTAVKKAIKKLKRQSEEANCKEDVER